MIGFLISEAAGEAAGNIMNSIKMKRKTIYMLRLISDGYIESGHDRHTRRRIPFQVFIVLIKEVFT